jgi:hypothetical protein
MRTHTCTPTAPARVASGARRSRSLAVGLITAFLLLCGAVSAQRAGAIEVAMQDDSVFLSQSFYDRGRALTQAQDLGVRWLRVNAFWSDYKRYGFAQLDGAVDAALSRGFRVQMTISGQSSFDKKGDHWLSSKSPKAARLGKFAKLVAQHFKGRVRRYSIWNEPNMPYFLSPTRRAASIYRALYLAGYKAIKSVDRRNAVLIGELAPRRNPLGFLARISGGLKADGLAYHPFQFYAAPGARDRTGVVGISSTPRIRSTLRSLARRHQLSTPRGHRLPIYFTEFGYIAKGGSVPMPDKRRADWIVKAYKYAKRQGVRQLLYYQLVHPPAGSNVSFDSGIVKLDGTPTIVYTALRRYLTGR